LLFLILYLNIIFLGVILLVSQDSCFIPLSLKGEGEVLRKRGFAPLIHSSFSLPFLFHPLFKWLLLF
jgi:hypothetical protein